MILQWNTINLFIQYFASCFITRCLMGRTITITAKPRLGLYREKANKILSYRKGRAFKGIILYWVN